MAQISEVIHSNETQFKTGQVIVRPGFKKIIPNQEVDPETEKNPDLPAAETLTVKDMMPEEEAHEISPEENHVANQEQKSNCMDFILITKVNIAGQPPLVKLPDSVIFREGDRAGLCAVSCRKH